MVFYNGPKCGASAPDHLHFQAGTSGILPLQRDWQRLYETSVPLLKLNDTEGIYEIKDYICSVLAIVSHTGKHDVELFSRLYESLPIKEDETEPMMNIVAWRSGRRLFQSYSHVRSIALIVILLMGRHSVWSVRVAWIWQD